MRVETNFEIKNSFNESPVEVWLDSPNDLEFVISMKEKSTLDLVGGKALNLMKLYQSGFPIPEGFCITTKAFDYFLGFNNIYRADDANEEEMYKKIMDSLMPPLLVEIITDAYHLYLDGKACAVRSSSPVEDNNRASFAGQFETCLNILDENSLMDAIKKCWASLWKKNAVNYRKKMDTGKIPLNMAVLVQHMIPAQVSGIVFTGENVIIETVWGLGTSLVGGNITPDRYIVSRDGTLIDQQIASKVTSFCIDKRGGVEEQYTPEHLRDKSILHGKTLKDLCILCLKIEYLFDCPQDIEWSIVDGNIMILQARPITVSPSPVIWSRANIGEMQPGYVTYLSRIPENRPDFYVQSLIPLLECFGVVEDTSDLKFTEYIYGYIYANMTTTFNTVGKIPGLSPEIIGQSIGLSNGEKSSSGFGIMGMIRIIPGALRVMKFMLDLPKKAREVIPRSTELISQINERDLEGSTLDELDALVWEMYDRNSDVVPVHVCTFMAIMAFYNFLEKILNSVGEPEETAVALISGLEGMCTSQIGIEIWKLAQIASQSSSVVHIIYTQKEHSLQELENLPEGEVFLHGFREFMEKYGDRCSQELELSVPRWKEMPEVVLSMVANTLTASAINPLEQVEMNKDHRLEIRDRVFKMLSKNPAEKILFSKLLDKIQQYLLIREQLKTTWVKGNTVMRMIYLTIARKFVEMGILSNTDEIFFLKMTEVSDIIAGSLPLYLIQPLIEERRKEKEECENLDVPDEIIGEPPPLEELRKSVKRGERFEGIGCSPGIVTGRARIIKDSNQQCEIKKGEILVIPVTNPGWGPLFLSAAGIVVELGGTLSHGIIIAREYGIPAVVGIHNATKAIQTGQLITIDGGKGTVIVESDFHDRTH
ncbi:MAG: hypothetical protein HXS53_00165 [Theionarchaea archaeon]|nr:hypothetical protein [Theionarchaea archaeon]